jgi:hypothetical protein
MAEVEVRVTDFRLAGFMVAHGAKLLRTEACEEDAPQVTFVFAGQSLNGNPPAKELLVSFPGSQEKWGQTLVGGKPKRRRSKNQQNPAAGEHPDCLARKRNEVNENEHSNVGNQRNPTPHANDALYVLYGICLPEQSTVSVWTI